jgi:predicted transcriptional regulator
MTQNATLGPLEQKIMKLAWSRKQITAREILEELKQERTIAYTTVITIMTRLVQKGYLFELEKRGKALVFQATQNQKTAMKGIIKKMFNSLVDQFGEEAVAAFVDEAHIHSREKTKKGTKKQL